MDDDAGRLGRVERALWVPPPGNFSKKSRIFFIALGIFLFAPSAYSLLFPSGNGSANDFGSFLVGIVAFLWGIGDAMKVGGVGATIRLFSWALIFPVAAVTIPISLYIEMGLLGLLFMVVIAALVLGLTWLSKKTGARA